METNVTKRTDIYSVDPRNVVVVENFNVRRDFALDELKEQIKAQGVLNPITVIPFKDDDGNEKYRLVDGERRLRATLAAIDEGADIKRIKALFLPRNTKEEDLLIEQMMRNEGKNFTEYEQAIMFQRFRDKFGYTASEIAAKFCKSQTFVGRCLSLLELAPEIQEKIENGEISTGAVRQIVSSNKEDEKAQIEAVQDAIADAKEKGNKSASVKNLQGDAKSQKDLKKVIDGFQLLVKYGIQGKIEIQEFDCRQIAIALHKATTMEDAIRKLQEMITPDIQESPEDENQDSIIKQWKDLKAKHQNSFILFRNGDFYEAFCDDAKPIAETLGIVLCKRGENDFCAFPHHALDTYLPKMVRKGMRVAICEPLADPKKEPKNPIKHEVEGLAEQENG